MVKQILSYLLIALWSVVLGKENDTGSINLKLDKGSSIYYASEIVEFSLKLELLPQNVKSKLIRLVLFDSLGNDIVNKLFLAQNGIVLKSTFLITKNTPTGTYVLKCFESTNDKSIQDYSMLIYVVNTNTFSQDDVTLRNDIDIPPYEYSYGNPIIIKGILSKNDSPLSYKIVTMQSRGETNLFSYTVTNESGEFTFYDSLFGTNELLFSSFNTGQTNVKIDFVNFNYFMNKSGVECTPYKLPYWVIKKQEQLKELVVNINYTNNSIEKMDIQLIDSSFDEHLILQEYVPLLTMKETIIELVPLKKIKEKNGKTFLFLLNDIDNSYHKKEPLYLIDRFLVNDFNKILTLDIDRVIMIETLYKTHDFETIIERFSQYGIFSVITKNRDYIPDSGLYMKIDGIENRK
ncbi:MAG: hypothetical protein OEW67_06600 [Cyclobacteriaceae bacterium]|nr:hypothetical protein [Cyclobacteriaceae bacterium]